MRKNTSRQTLSDEAIELIAARFHALGEVSRLKLIVAVGNGEKNVSQLVEVTGLSQANVSRHLQTLTDAGILVRRKEGVCVFYSTADPTVFNLCEVVSTSLKRHLSGQAKVFSK
jgi:ArsR family transcriptional regulator